MGARRAGTILRLSIAAVVASYCAGDICGKPSPETWEGNCTVPAVGGWGSPDGKGLMVKKDGTRKEMEYLHGKPVGYGAFRWMNGQTYEGGWLDGVLVRLIWEPLQPFGGAPLGTQRGAKMRPKWDSR